MADSNHAYTYGYTRIAQVSDIQTGYFLGDALGSVRHAVYAPPSSRSLRARGESDPEAKIRLMQSYSPYGEVTSSIGDFETNYNFTGEWTDGTGLVNLRARTYDPATGRFVSRDTWGGEFHNPLSLNKWNYGLSNPLRYTDPSGNNPISQCIALFAVSAIVDGPLPVGDAIGIAGCLTLFGTATYTAFIAAQQAPEVAEEVDTGCITNWGEWLSTRPYAPDPQQTPTPEPLPVPVPFPNPTLPDVTETPRPKHIFYFSEVGEYPYPGRETSQILKDLEFISYIPGINGYIGQINVAKSWSIMGRKFEAERALFYFRQGKLLGVNSTSKQYDLGVRSMGTIKYIEIKWAEGVVSKSVLSHVVQQARLHPSGTFMLETTWISQENKKYLYQEGGVEYP